MRIIKTVAAGVCGAVAAHLAVIAVARSLRAWEVPEIPDDDEPLP